MKKRLKVFLGNVSPWFVIGMSLILTVVVLVVAFMNYNREQRHMSRLLTEKGTAIIKAIEAGTRTGMMGMLGGSENFQVLLREIASQPDILYIVIANSSGEVLAHSDKGKINTSFITPVLLSDLKVNTETKWRVLERPDSPKSFEVYNLFLPIDPHDQKTQNSFDKRKHGRDHLNDSAWIHIGEQGQILNPTEPPVIFIGMGYGAFDEAISEDIVLTLSTSGILLLLGFGGFVSLFWLQRSARSEKLLQDTRALTSEIVANIPDSIVICGMDERISFVNKVAIRTLGMTKEDGALVVGKMAKNVLRPNLWELRSLINKSRPVVEQELELDIGNFMQLPVSVVVTEIISDDSTFVGQMFIIRDLSQVKQLLDDIQKADKMAAIGHLAAGVAHEVRNPLSSIKGYATYFGTLFSEDSENRKAADVMTAEVDRLNRVISELLGVARPTDIILRNTNLPSLLQSSLRLVKQEAEGAKVTISLDIGPGVDDISADPDRITQALINLYINAIQAMPDGGELNVVARQRGSHFLLQVADTGAGLPNGVRSRIFDPYFTTKQTGTGLGLAIVYKIVEAHDGTIEVEYTGEHGTSFSLSIPNKTEKGRK